MYPPRRPDPSAPADARDTSAVSRTAPGGGPAPAEPQPGQMIGPYRVVRELGRGGMAVVYEADDTELARRVALKVLVGPAADEQGKRRFVREAQAQAKVHHEHVVTIYRVGEDRGVSYLAMPVLNGQTLAQALTTVPRPPLASAIRIGQEIAEGLAAAHAVGLIHRDIKPANVWLEAPKWRVRILDFGLARPPHAESGADITIQGQIVGTPAYMSPEQARGAKVDHRTDLWSLGVVLYQMAVGDKPFAGDNTLSLMTSIVSAEPPPPVALVPEVPPVLSDLILRLLAKDPAHRPASADEVVAALAALGGAPAPSGWHPVAPADPWSGIDSTEVVARPQRRAEPSRRDDYEDEDEEPPRRPRSLKWLWAVGAVAAFALLGGLVALAVNAVSPPAKTTEPTAEPPRPAPPKPAPAKPPAPESDRAAIEALSPSARLKVLVNDRGGSVEVAPGAALPAGQLALLQIDFTDNDALGPHFVTNTLLPALANLRSLTDIRMKRWQMTLAPEHLRQMAAMPLAATLVRLDAQVELTPASLADLRKFTVLNDLTVNVPKPDDALFARLAELRKVEVLTFIELSPANGLTEKGWNAILGMPLTWLAMARSPAAPSALRALTARRGTPPPALEFVACPDLTDDDLRELSEKPTDVRALTFRIVPLTDDGVKHLAAVKSLRAVSLGQTRATEPGARALFAARPDVKVVFNDVTIGKN